MFGKAHMKFIGRLEVVVPGRSIVANCPGISRTVPNFLPVSRKGPENLL